MENILLTINVLLAIILVILVLIQKSEGGALGIGVVTAVTSAITGAIGSLYDAHPIKMMWSKTIWNKFITKFFIKDYIKKGFILIGLNISSSWKESLESVSKAKYKFGNSYV